MTQQVIFIILSVVLIVSAILVVTLRNLFHAALALMASFLGVAGYYVLLEAGFLGMAQLLVYIGAISILIIFAVMMTRRLMQTIETPFNSQPIVGLLGAGLLLVILIVVITGLYSVTPGAESLLGMAPPVEPVIIESSVARLGRAFVSADGFLLPFILISILLLAALVGSIYIAWPKHEEENS
ncbi:MAG: NADH-quinone oxidoreductase subunit J [Chloroflexota bacterium]